jgi:carbonic anhydrase
MHRLVAGYNRFRTTVFPSHADLFRKLAHGQQPEAVLITCSDSRVMPEMILQCEPGQIFPIRMAGNLVPPTSDPSGVAATIEYAVRVLKVADVIICGHSGCGAMKELLEQAHVEDLPEVTSWLRRAGPASQWLRHTLSEVSLTPQQQLELITQANVITQLEHLKHYPAVAEGLRKHTVRLHGWVYDIASGEIKAFDPASGMFNPLEELHTQQDERKVAC